MGAKTSAETGVCWPFATKAVVPNPLLLDCRNLRKAVGRCGIRRPSRSVTIVTVASPACIALWHGHSVRYASGVRAVPGKRSSGGLPSRSDGRCFFQRGALISTWAQPFAQFRFCGFMRAVNLLADIAALAEIDAHSAFASNPISSDKAVPGFSSAAALGTI